VDPNFSLFIGADYVVGCVSECVCVSGCVLVLVIGIIWNRV